MVPKVERYRCPKHPDITAQAPGICEVTVSQRYSCLSCGQADFAVTINPEGRLTHEGCERPDIRLTLITCDWPLVQQDLPDT